MSLLARDTLRSFRRSPMLSALSVAAIAFSLYTTGLYALLSLNFTNAMEGVAERVEVVGFLMRGTPAETITLAAQDIASFPEVLTVEFVSEDEALQQARAELIEFREAYLQLQTNPLPASLEIRLKEGFRSSEHASAVADRLAGFAFIDQVQYGQDWLSRLDRIRDVAKAVQLVIGLAFLLVAIGIIGVTIRITVLQRAEEITIMRLVGATNAFIRGPFVLDGAIKGTLGGLLAMLLCRLTYDGFRAGLGTELADLRFFSTGDMFLILIFGTLIGLVGSLVSVGRHLRRV